MQRVEVALLVVVADTGARLHRHHGDARVVEVELCDMGGLGEGLVHLGGVAIVIVEHHVVRHALIELRRAGLDRVRRAGDRRQGIDIDLNCLRRILGLGQRFGHHDGNRITHEPHLADRQDRLVGLQQRRAVLAFQRHAADEIAVAGGHHVLAGPDSEHAGQLLRLGGVDLFEHAVRVRGAHDHRVGLSGKVQVVGVFALAADQGVVLLADDRLANPVLLRRNGVFEGTR